jgi:hypothetical protein
MFTADLLDTIVQLVSTSEAVFNQTPISIVGEKVLSLMEYITALMEAHFDINVHSARPFHALWRLKHMIVQSAWPVKRSIYGMAYER